MRRKEGRGGMRDEESEKMKNEKVAKGRIIGLAGPCSLSHRLASSRRLRDNHSHVLFGTFRLEEMKCRYAFVLFFRVQQMIVEPPRDHHLLLLPHAKDLVTRVAPNRVDGANYIQPMCSQPKN